MAEISLKPLISQGWLRAVLFFGFFFLMYAFFFLVAKYTLTPWMAGHINGESAATQLNGLWNSVIISSITSFASVWIFRKWVDRKPIFYLGFAWKNNTSYTATGGLAAIAMLGLGSLLLMLTGSLSFSGWNVNPVFLLESLVLMLLVAVSEELVFRGYLLNNLMQSMNKWLALVISAVLFFAIHLGNPDVGFIPMLEIFVAGLMLGINYIFTRNLWFGIALHFAWNFLQGPVLGYKVSGIVMPSLLQQDITGPAWLTGGPFGFEGSVLAIFLNLGIIGLLAILYNRGEPMKANR